MRSWFRIPLDAWMFVYARFMSVILCLRSPSDPVQDQENGIGRQRHELSKQALDLHINVALFSETNLKPHDRFHIQNITFIKSIATRKKKKAELPLQSEKASPTCM
jgi:hypothetical protein